MEPSKPVNLVPVGLVVTEQRRPLIDLEFLNEMEEAAGYQPFPHLKRMMQDLQLKRERCKRSRLWRVYYWIQAQR